MSAERFMSLYELIAKDEAERRRERQRDRAELAWQIGAFLAGSKDYPAFPDYLRAIGLVE